MVAGRLQEKNGFFYIVLSYTDSAGKRRQPWIGTGLPVKGNKKRAEKMLADTRKDFTIPKGQVSELSPDMAFSDYMRYWLKMMRTAVTETTYSSYCFNAVGFSRALKMPPPGHFCPAGRKAPGTGCSNPTLQPLHSLPQK